MNPLRRPAKGGGNGGRDALADGSGRLEVVGGRDAEQTEESASLGAGASLSTGADDSSPGARSFGGRPGAHLSGSPGAPLGGSPGAGASLGVWGAGSGPGTGLDAWGVGAGPGAWPTGMPAGGWLGGGPPGGWSGGTGGVSGAFSGAGAMPGAFSGAGAFFGGSLACGSSSIAPFTDLMQAAAGATLNPDFSFSNPAYGIYGSDGHEDEVDEVAVGENSAGARRSKHGVVLHRPKVVKKKGVKKKKMKTLMTVIQRR
ncbi:hypothetical protein PR202_gb13579 [Eleusine coracana subsp. coracana]|uniref:Uncharacterized protein n=1 Tax=Eleusine coracana subsp. coracana TaxID=191504 RepID=A0AAV5EST0_ELECO|nr:hypothetical protein PR202_gb13579 [Eleusine coracana subsp. coracana]